MKGRSLYDEQGRPIKDRDGFSSGSDYTHKTRKVNHINHKDNLKGDEVKNYGTRSSDSAPAAPIVYDMDKDTQGYIGLAILSFFFGILGIPFGIYVIKSLGKKKNLNGTEKFARGLSMFAVTINSILLFFIALVFMISFSGGF